MKMTQETKKIKKFARGAALNHFAHPDEIEAAIFEKEVENMCFQTNFLNWDSINQEIVLNALTHVAIHSFNAGIREAEREI